MSDVDTIATVLSLNVVPLTLAAEDGRAEDACRVVAERTVVIQSWREFDSRGPAASAHLRNCRVILDGRLFGYFADREAAEQAARAA